MDVPHFTTRLARIDALLPEEVLAGLRAEAEAEAGQAAADFEASERIVAEVVERLGGHARPEDERALASCALRVVIEGRAAALAGAEWRRLHEVSCGLRARIEDLDDAREQIVARRLSGREEASDGEELARLGADLGGLAAELEQALAVEKAAMGRSDAAGVVLDRARAALLAAERSAEAANDLDRACELGAQLTVVLGRIKVRCGGRKFPWDVGRGLYGLVRLSASHHRLL